MAYIGIDFVAPFDPSGYTEITPTQLAQLVGGLGPTANVGLIVMTTDVAGVPSVPSVATYPKLANYSWLRIGAANAALYVWNPNGAIDPTLNQWQIANINSITTGSITGSQIAALTITDNNIFSVGWSKLPSGAAVGGSLVGSMPNPSLANNSVGVTNIAPALTNKQILQTVVGATAWVSSMFESSAIQNTLGAAGQALGMNTTGSDLYWIPRVVLTGMSAAFLTNTTATQVKTAHGLGVVPSRVNVVLQCVINDAATGYQAGNEISLTAISGSDDRSVNYFVDNTYLYINWPTTAAASMVVYAGTSYSAPTASTNFKFKAYLEA